MNGSFFGYFFSYIFKSRTRQKLIFLAIIGLLISSFSLTVLQGIMGGLQGGLIKRSKDVLGNGYIDLGEVEQLNPQYESLVEKLIQAQIVYSVELELELMIQNDSYVSPIILHGIDYHRFTPDFLKKRKSDGLTDISNIVLGSDLGQALRAYFGSRVKITSPAHTDILLEEIPRQASSYVSDFFSSELPEIDSLHGWVRLSFLQNLIRHKRVNKIRIYSDHVAEVKEILLDKQFKDYQFVTWEDKHSTLVWALKLETHVMLFLFTAMSVLIGICITSGFLIFYNKIKVDLASFWIIGMSKDNLFKLIYLFGQGLAITFCTLGVLAGIGVLVLLDTNTLAIMPEQFVERNVPVKFDSFHIFLSFIIPYLVASVFTHYTFKIFRKDTTSFISQIRKIG